MITASLASETIEGARKITSEELSAEHFPDDNNLLSALGTAGYLVNDAITGYLPSVLFTTEDEAEIFIDRPLGVRGLMTNGGASFHYESVHRHLLDLKYYHRFPGSDDSGHVIEIDDGKRLFLPKGENSLEAKIRHGRADKDAVAEELNRLDLAGIGRQQDFIAQDYWDVGLHFTGCLREAASWMEYRYTKPWDSENGEYFERTLTVDEATTCLSIRLADLAISKLTSNISVIRSVVG